MEMIIVSDGFFQGPDTLNDFKDSQEMSFLSPKVTTCGRHIRVGFVGSDKVREHLSRSVGPQVSCEGTKNCLIPNERSNLEHERLSWAR